MEMVLVAIHRPYTGCVLGVNPDERSKNVALGAVSCAFVPILSEGGPAKWLKNKNLSNHLCDFEHLLRGLDQARQFRMRVVRRDPITAMRM